MTTEGEPRGRGAYLWLIDFLPAAYEPRLRAWATSVRQLRLTIRLFRERWVRRALRAVRRSDRAWRRRLRLVRRSARRPGRFLSRCARTVRTGSRRLTRLLRPASRTLRRARRGLNDLSPDALQGTRALLPNVSADPTPLTWSGRGRIARALFPPTVRLPGEGQLVAIDALGRPTSEVVAARSVLPPRILVLTDAATVGDLRAADIPYEYLPRATPGDPAESIADRISWLDYVYGIDRIERLDHYAQRSTRPATGVDHTA